MPVRTRADVWLRSRTPGLSERRESELVSPLGSGYADIVRHGRRWRFSHAAASRGAEGQRTWLVFDDVGSAM